jgi:hypothetical protein
VTVIAARGVLHAGWFRHFETGFTRARMPQHHDED